MKKITTLLFFFFSFLAWSQPPIITGGNTGGGTPMPGNGGGVGINPPCDYCITASPNPAGQSITIAAADSVSTINSYTFYNADQSAVLTQNTGSVSSVTIDISNLRSGTYALYVYINNNTTSPVIKQIIKQ